ncbi:MAG: hypothetical protein R3C01_13605 [Planctomycetaceae bacterium]
MRFTTYALLLAVSPTVLFGAEPTANAEKPAAAAPATETVTVKFDTLTFQAPKSWVNEKPKSNLRLGQFSIPAVEGDKEPAELAIFDRIAGSDKANIERWIGQFSPEGLSTKMTKGSAEAGDYIFVELTGSYKKPVGPPFLMKTDLVEGYSMLGVVFASKAGGNYFFKLTGPTKTATAAAQDFRRSFGGDASKETEYTLE